MWFDSSFQNGRLRDWNSKYVFGCFNLSEEVLAANFPEGETKLIGASVVDRTRNHEHPPPAFSKLLSTSSCTVEVLT